MEDIERTLERRIAKCLFKGKAVVVYGARQMGKTTMVRHIQARHHAVSLCLNCDEPDVRAELTDASSTKLKALVGGKRLVVIDEAQRVKNIGLTLKLMVDNLPQTQVLATGSSAFALSQEIAEPLTGRCHEFHLKRTHQSESPSRTNARDVFLADTTAAGD